MSNNNDNIKVELSNGEVQEFDLLVTADGQWSRVRKQCFPPEHVNVVDLGVCVACWTISRLPSDNGRRNIYMALESRLISLRPEPHSTIRAMFTRMPCNEAQKKGAARGIQERQADTGRAFSTLSNRPRCPNGPSCLPKRRRPCPDGTHRDGHFASC